MTGCRERMCLALRQRTRSNPVEAPPQALARQHSIRSGPFGRTRRACTSRLRRPQSDQSRVTCSRCCMIQPSRLVRDFWQQSDRRRRSSTASQGPETLPRGAAAAKTPDPEDTAAVEIRFYEGEPANTVDKCRNSRPELGYIDSAGVKVYTRVERRPVVAVRVRVSG